MSPSNSPRAAAAPAPLRTAAGSSVRGHAVALLGAAVSALSACAAGPDYAPPAPPAASAYTREALPELAAAGTALVSGQDPPRQWWTLFSAPRLNDTMQLALRGNRDLAAAQQNLAQAAAIAHAGTSALYPELDYNAGVGRQKLGAASLGNVQFPAFTYYTVGPSVSYVLDYTGGLRRAVEAQGAQVDFQRYQLDAAYLSLTGNVALAALHIAAARAQIDSLAYLLGEDQKNVEFVQKAFDAGSVPRVDVLSAQSQLANDQTLQPPMLQQLSVARHQLSVLVGRLPADWAPPDFDIKELSAPRQLPLTLPSELVHRRPDIRAAEAQLHAAAAGVGVATANLYPQITLSAALNLQSTTPNQLFASSSVVGALLAGLTGPLFDHGARRDRQRAAQQAMEAALDRYEQTVLVAFGQVADLLEALDHDAQLERAQQRAADAALANLDLTRQSYQAGNVGVLQVLDAQRSNEQAQLGLVRARVQHLQDDMQLLLAIGGAAPGDGPAEGAPGAAAGR
jgi:NodT family efflux transporter outer membrane factor (OMF) lipoprotein